MRGKAIVAGLMLGLAALTGCKQQCFITECDVKEYSGRGLLPRGLENDPSASIIPATSNVPAPSTVLNPERPARNISMRECIAIALEQGNVGSQSPLFPGIANDTLVQFGGRLVGGSDSIRVLALDPAIAAADIESALSKFDARWLSNMQWQKQDNAVANVLQNFQNGDLARFSTGFAKPLATGGFAGITYSHDYNFLSQPPPDVTNPFHRPRLQVTFEQPLLRDFGVDINQLNIQHPGSTLNQAFRPSGGRTEGILITRLRFDQARAEFERNVNFMLLNVEFAYWNLYGAYWTLYSREQALRQAYEAWRINKARYEAGRIAIMDFAQSRGQYELFRGQRLTALGEVLDRERQLRGLLGMPVEDGTRLVPIDTPTLAPFNPDWQTALNESLALRPELVLARQDLKFRQLDLIHAKNQLRPDLRFGATYDVNGLGTRMDGPGIDNALRSLTLNNFNNWSLNLTLDVPIGFRDAHALTRTARLNLSRSYAQLQDQEDKAQRFLALQYRRIAEQYEQIRIQRAQREAFATQLEARFKEFLAGRGTLDILLEAQRFWADALANEYRAVVEYNNALAGFQFAKGTLLLYDNVSITEGPLPHCAQMRAVDHERERNVAWTLRERAAIHNTCCTEPGKECIGLPELPTTTTVPVPALFVGQPPLPEIESDLPRLQTKPTPLPGGFPEKATGTPLSKPLPVDLAPIQGMIPPSNTVPSAGHPQLVMPVQTGEPTGKQ